MRQLPIEPILRLDGITAAGGVTDVTFHVAEGEIVTLLGAGGLDVLAMVAGLRRAQRGTIAVAGRILTRTPTYRRPIGLVRAGQDLFPHLDVRAHVGFSPGVSRQRVQEVMERLGLMSLADRLPAALTPEQRLRTGLGRALAAVPRLLLLDDPLALLPPPRQAAMQDLLRRIAEEVGLAMLQATEEPSRAFGLGNRIGVVSQGHLMQIGQPQEVYGAPVSLAVAIATGPVSALGGLLIEHEADIGRLRLACGATIEARLSRRLPIGQPCVIALRPELIALARIPAAEMGEGAVPARLIEALFCGDHIRLRCRVGLDDPLDAASEVIVIRPSGGALPRPGEVSLAWQASHAHAFAVALP